MQNCDKDLVENLLDMLCKNHGTNQSTATSTIRKISTMKYFVETLEDHNSNITS